MPNRVREARKAKNLSQWQIALLTSIHPADLCAIERGRKPAFPKWRRKIAAALGMAGREAELFDEDKVGGDRTGGGGR